MDTDNFTGFTEQSRVKLAPRGRRQRFERGQKFNHDITDKVPRKCSAKFLENAA